MNRFCAALLLALGTPLAGQQPPPPERVVTIDSLVVIAEREATTLSSSTAAVSVLTADQLARIPQVTLADALRQVPGFAVVGFDGLGYDPQLMVRGFYGGGEAEYVVVLVDGQPLNDLPGGRVPWDAIPLERVARVEIVRGSASPLWGDAALGGVINVITRRPGAGALGWSLAAGSHGTWRGSGDAHTRVAGRDLTVYGGLDRTDGYRTHAARTAGRAGATLALASGPAGSLELRARTHWRRFDEPGPLLGSAAELDPAASDVFFRFDETDERGYRLGLDGSRELGARARLSGSVLGELRDVEAVRTLALAPDFADTQARDLGTRRALATTQLAIENTGLP
ncbi:MAG: TonB-dependent receptor plug domain-containing protein, partial [Gemmatimonadota bacterium]